MPTGDVVCRENGRRLLRDQDLVYMTTVGCIVVAV